jgi:adenosylhomocysteinase
VRGLRERLQAEGFRALEERQTRSPLQATRLERGEEWLALVVARADKPHRLHLTDHYELSLSGAVRDREHLSELSAALPFTALEIESVARDMSLTAAIGDRMREWLPAVRLDDTPLAGHAGIFTIHHQTDFVLLLEKALELGIEQSLVTVIDKEYRYRLSRRVDAHIRETFGIPVYPYSKLTEGISEHIRRVQQAREDQGAATWTPTLVIDDGGYILPELHRHFGPFLSLFKGVVEQTTSGIWKLEPFTDLGVPLFSVAESDLKATVEAHGVAQAALTSVRRLLPHEKFDGRIAVVVGFGRIGEALAEVLRRHNVEVHVVDEAAAMQVRARERGFPSHASLPALLASISPRYIFACARPGAVDRESLLAVRGECALISVTSRDVAIDKGTLADSFVAEPLGTLGTRYTREGASLLLLADGFPVNFHFAESMPNQQSDLVMASLLLGAISLARADPPWPAGNDSQRANAILNEGTLLEDFLRASPALGPAVS